MSLSSEHADTDPHSQISARYFRSHCEVVRAVVFLFHSRGGTAQTAYELLGQHLLRDDSILVVPEACNNCWYPYRFDEEERINQPWLDSAMGWVHREVTAFVEQGLDPSHILFGGFSQGSAIALEYPFRYPQHYGGVFCLSGGLVGPLGTREPLDGEALAGTPVLLASADNDDWIPMNKFEETAELLEASGAQVDSRLYKGLGHAICDDEIASVQAMIDKVMKSGVRH